MAPFTPALPPNSWGARLTASGHGVCARGQRARGTQKRDAQESPLPCERVRRPVSHEGQSLRLSGAVFTTPTALRPLSKTRPSRGTRRRRALGRGRRGVQVRRLLAPPHRSWNDPALRPCRRRRSPSGYGPAWQIASSAALPWTRARQLGGNGPAVLRVFAFFPGKFE